MTVRIFTEGNSVSLEKELNTFFEGWDGPGYTYHLIDIKFSTTNNGRYSAMVIYNRQKIHHSTFQQYET